MPARATLAGWPAEVMKFEHLIQYPYYEKYREITCKTSYDNKASMSNEVIDKIVDIEREAGKL